MTLKPQNLTSMTHLTATLSSWRAMRSKTRRSCHCESSRHAVGTVKLSVTRRLASSVEEETCTVFSVLEVLMMIGFELYTLVVLAEGLGILVEELHDLPVQR